MSGANRLVIFDCDGTLADGEHLIAEAMTMMFDREGLAAPTRAAVQRVIGLSLADAMAVLVPEADGQEHERLAQSYKDAFLAMREARGNPVEPLYPGVIEALEALSNANFLLAVATGKSMRGLKRVLAAHDIGHHFISLQTADHHPSKPHPSMIQTAMVDAGAVPETTLMIGDTSYDMAMARSAGAFGIGVTWGYHGADELTAAGAQHLIDDFSALAPLAHRLTETFHDQPAA
ncbi:HAD-IA family hydrolase [Gimibacter soli]|uniref:HAD-IA family hydrolase n=1 Tax=Gimibacter soli TaxID=3024400 RepID=A0AAE9XR39_9PROT|nr:HAD-IA family hydrolase [Gimibacter soli]WCL55662.1 HAD-IA family hydrolase [Gimibacter soli]